MTDTWITLPHGGAGAGFDVRALFAHIRASGRKYIIQGRAHCRLADHPKPQSLDVWLRTHFTDRKDTAQAVNKVLNELASTGLFVVGRFACPDSGRHCKALKLLRVAPGRC